jgi:hypothetical protein
MAKQRVAVIHLGRDDLMAMREAIVFALDNESKVGQHRRRVNLYSLRRRIDKALLDLER